MTTRRFFWLSSVILATLFVAPACYTLVKHPSVRTVAEEQTQSNQCTSCHYEDEIWGFHHPPNHRPYMAARSYNFGYYYAMPWWYDSYWYDTSPGSRTVPLENRHMRPSAGNSAAGTTGGHITSTPSPKSTGAPVRTNEKDATSEGKNDDTKNKNRNTRPRGKKEKENG